MEKIIILGGGIAGLTCLNALLDRGMDALLLEGGIIGSPKMCGEFIAPYARQTLENWEIGPAHSINTVDFYVKQKKITVKLPDPALAFARSDAEHQLAARARKLGGRIIEQTFVEQLKPKQGSDPFVITFNNGERKTSETVFFATGKFPQTLTKKITLPFRGFKFHLPQIIRPHCLSMFSFDHAYLGLVPINEAQSNCAGLMVDAKIPTENAKDYFLQLIELHPTLKQMLSNISWDAVNYFEARAPDFTLKNNPDWEDAYWIGDAVAGLYPAIGSGFAHSVQSALMAVDFYCKKQPKTYRTTMLKSLKPKIHMGKILHHVLLHPKICRSLMPCIQRMPKVTEYFLRKMEYVT